MNQLKLHYRLALYTSEMSAYEGSTGHQWLLREPSNLFDETMVMMVMMLPPMVMTNNVDGQMLIGTGPFHSSIYLKTKKAQLLK